MDGFPIIIPIMIVLVGGFILFGWAKVISSLVKAAAAKRKDASSPEQCGEATAVDKRERNASDDAGLYYFVTFEDGSGSRYELYATAEQYASIARGDHGVVASRGRMLVRFTRTSSAYSSPAEPDTSGEVHLCPSCGATYKGSVCDYCGTPWHKE